MRRRPRRGARRPAPPTRVRALGRLLAPRWARTLLAVLVWVAAMPIWVMLTSAYISYRSAWIAGYALALTAAAAPTLWPSRTAPWRTVAWTGLASTAAGMLLLSTGIIDLALTGATLTGATVITARAGQLGRRSIGLLREWRTLRKEAS